jgi:hypothetical protein
MPDRPVTTWACTNKVGGRPSIAPRACGSPTARRGWCHVVRHRQDEGGISSLIMNGDSRKAVLDNALLRVLAVTPLSALTAPLAPSDDGGRQQLDPSASDVCCSAPASAAFASLRPSGGLRFSLVNPCGEPPAAIAIPLLLEAHAPRAGPGPPALHGVKSPDRLARTSGGVVIAEVRPGGRTRQKFWLGPKGLPSPELDPAQPRWESLIIERRNGVVRMERGELRSVAIAVHEVSSGIRPLTTNFTRRRAAPLDADPRPAPRTRGQPRDRHVRDRDGPR